MSNFKLTLYCSRYREKFDNTIYPYVKPIHNSDELCQAVAYDHVCAQYSDHRRKNENFIQADCAMFDVDNTETDEPDEWIRPIDVRLDFPNVPFYICYSRNHMKPKAGKTPRPKFHVYFPDMSIENREEYEQNKRKVISYFPAFDASAKDAARFFVGVENPIVEYYDGEVVLMDFMKNMQDDKGYEQVATDWAKTVDIIPEGERNSTMYRYACRMLVRLKNTDKAYQMFMQEATKCSPRLDEKELDSIWNSALKFYQEKVCSKTGDVLSVTEEWESPIPFQAISTPDFPTDCLPVIMASFVKALAESTQTPEEMAGILSLGIFATAFQSRYTVEINSDWSEPLCLYVVAIAPPGERKSAVIKNLSKPLYDYEENRRKAEAVEVAQSQTERDILEKKMENLKREIIKSTGDDLKEQQKMKRLKELSAKLEEFEEKHPFQLLVDDTTTEKLVDTMDEQGGCITVASAEGGVFSAMAGRYDKNTDFDVYLKGHSDDPIRVDRINRKGNHINHPRLTMILTIQPEVLKGLMENEAFRGRGLCGRFLYSVCKSKVGYRNVDPEQIPQQVKKDYEGLIKRVLDGKDKGVIHLSEEARRKLLEYSACVENRLGEEWEYIRDWGSKLVGETARIAALIHAVEVQDNTAETPIKRETMEAAIMIAEYLSVHAMAAYQIIGADKDYVNAQYLLSKIKKLEQDVINKSELFDLCKGKVGFETVKGMEPALQILVDKHYIKVVESQNGKKGRPSQKIYINPKIKNSKNSK